MPGKILIDVGIKIDDKQVRSAFSSAFNSLKGVGDNVNIPDDLKNQIKEMTSELEKLQEKYDSLSHSKVTSGTFEKEKSSILEQIDAIEQRTTVLETSVKSLIATLSSSDSSGFSNWIKDLRSSMDDLKTSTTDTVEAISKVTSGIGGKTKFQLSESVDSQVDKLKNALDTLDKISNLDYDLGIKFDGDDLGDGFDKAEEAINEYIKARKKLDSADSNDTDFASFAKKYADAAYKVQTIFEQLRNSFGDEILDEGFFKKKDGGYFTGIEYFEKVESEVRERAESINNVLENIGKTGANTSKPNTISIDFDTEKSTAGLTAKLKRAINATQKYADSNPIEVEINLITGWQKQSKKYSDAFKKMQDNISKIEDENARAQFKGVLDEVGKGWGKEIGFELKSSLGETEEDLKRVIKSVSSILKKEKFAINPEIKFSEETISKAKDQLNDVAGFNVENLEKYAAVIKEIVSGISENKLTLGLDGESDLYTNIEKLSSNLDELLSVYKKFTSIGDDSSVFNLANAFKSLDGSSAISEIINSFQKLETTLVEFSDTYRKVNGLLTTSELDSRFKEIGSAAEKLNGKDLRKTQNELKQIAESFQSYKTFGGLKDLSDLEGVDKKVLTSLQKKYGKLNTEESSNGVKEEVNAFNMAESAAKTAAEAKERFATANRELLQSVIASVQGIDNEGKAFENINKLFNSISKDKDGSKIESLLSALKEIQEIMNTSVGADSFIKSLENLANTGDSLKDLATVLKATKKQIDNAKKNVSGEETGLVYDYNQERLNTNIENIRESGKNILSKYGTLIGNVIRENKNGLIEMVGLVRTANNELSEITISSANGDVWNIDKQEANTDRMLKKAQTLEKIRRVWERMNKVPNNKTDEVVFDKDSVDAEAWEKMVALAKKYSAEIGNLQKVTRQVRQDRDGNLLESFSFIGDKGHVTMGREGDIVASSQELASLEKIKQGFDELTRSAQRYNELKEKSASGKINEHEKAELAELDAQYQKLIADVKEYNSTFGNNNIGQTALDNYLRASSQKYDEYIEKYINGAEGKFARNELQKANQRTDFTPVFKSQIQEAKAMMDELNSLRGKYNPGDIWNADDLLRVNQIMERVNSTIKELGNNANVLAKTGDVDKLISKASKDLNDNTMSRGLRTRYQDLIDSLQQVRYYSGSAEDALSQIDKVTLGRLQGQFQELHAEMERTGQTGKGFFKQFTGAITSKSAQFLATYFSLQDFVRYGRELGKTVTEINSAQTELRKVSDASQTRIAENFETSAKTAQELGSTITDVINNTADWSRLGYSVDDAEKLARVTTLYQTVGDNMTQQTASESLISTMKGFQLEADEAESVVDRINEVANNYAIDTAGIGEALQRSASAFNTAHTDLDKSIALITASNTVLQDPEKVGTMWNTVAMRIRGASTE